jgi:hypothetical protein
MALIFQDPIQGRAIGSTPGFGSVESAGGGTASIVDAGLGNGTKAARFACPAGSTGTQRSESLIGAYGSPGTTLHFGWWWRVNGATPTNWWVGMQQRRNCTPGNGPIGIIQQNGLISFQGGDTDDRRMDAHCVLCVLLPSTRNWSCHGL